MWGDSLMRHLVQTLRALAIGDLDLGLSKHMGDSAWVCECDGAYDDGHARRFPGDYTAPYNALCRSASLAGLALEKVRDSWPAFCPRWGAADFLPPWADWYIDYPPPRAPYRLVSGGLHSPSGGLDASTAQHFYGAPPPGAARLLYATLHAPGGNKAKQFIANFGPDATIAYNAMVREHAAAANATLFDAYAITFNTPSIGACAYKRGGAAPSSQGVQLGSAALPYNRPSLVSAPFPLIPRRPALPRTNKR